jgi:hypothetical protein
VYSALPQNRTLSPHVPIRTGATRSRASTSSVEPGSNRYSWEYSKSRLVNVSEPPVSRAAYRLLSGSPI